jgi:hypothetical protein
MASLSFEVVSSCFGFFPNVVGDSIRCNIGRKYCFHSFIIIGCFQRARVSPNNNISRDVRLLVAIAGVCRKALRPKGANGDIAPDDEFMSNCKETS